MTGWIITRYSKRANGRNPLSGWLMNVLDGVRGFIGTYLLGWMNDEFHSQRAGTVGFGMYMLMVVKTLPSG